MNYLLPDSNYQARTYIQHLKMSENFDDSILERIQKSNYRSDREMDISAIVAELNHIEAQIKKIDQNESMKNRDLIQKHLIEKERQARIKLFNFFKIPVYLISLILIALPIGIIIRRLNKALIGLVSLGLVILFYVLFLEFETILENVNYPIIFLFTPEFLFSLTGIILLFYFNKIYILYNKKG
jgi:lipopolysaccharide export LptBFGC system permease protein LptF